MPDLPRWLGDFGYEMVVDWRRHTLLLCLQAQLIVAFALSHLAEGYVRYPVTRETVPTVPEWARRFPRKEEGGCGDYRRWDLGHLQIEAGWRSQQMRFSHDITLVTQSSLSRLHMLEASCQTWTGVIALAIHVPVMQGRVLLESGTKTNMSAVIQRLSNLHAKLEAQGACRIDMALFSEEVDARVFSFLYPVNALRNRALMIAETKVVLLLDVDFVVSPGLSEPRHYRDILTQALKKKAIVLPAFKPLASELNARAFGLKVKTWNKASIELMCREKRMTPFRENKLHDATNYGRWLLTNKSYDIAFHEGYEPYVMVAKQFIPWYDERFRGYFANKQLQLHHFFRLGFKFVAHPTEFVVHYPHSKSKGKLAVKFLGLYPKVKGMYWEAMAEMTAGTYRPVTSFSCGFQSQSLLMRSLYLYSSILLFIAVLLARFFGLCFCPATMVHLWPVTSSFSP